ncbi:MAG: hypothetical protein ABIJ50_10445 [Pseudomonadota bacterium]
MGEDALLPQKRLLFAYDRLYVRRSCLFQMSDMKMYHAEFDCFLSCFRGKKWIMLFLMSNQGKNLQMDQW